MDEEYWKSIVNELTEQLKVVSIERAVARTEVQRSVAIIEQLKNRIQEIEKADGGPDKEL